MTKPKYEVARKTLVYGELREGDWIIFKGRKKGLVIAGYRVDEDSVVNGRATVLFEKECGKPYPTIALFHLDEKCRKTEAKGA
jgi:hypothetical protein